MKVHSVLVPKERGGECVGCAEGHTHTHTHTEGDCAAMPLCSAELPHKEVNVLNTPHLLFCLHLFGLCGLLYILSPVALDTLHSRNDMTATRHSSVDFDF